MGSPMIRTSGSTGAATAAGGHLALNARGGARGGTAMACRSEWWRYQKRRADAAHGARWRHGFISCPPNSAPLLPRFFGDLQVVAMPPAQRAALEDHCLELEPAPPAGKARTAQVMDPAVVALAEIAVQPGVEVRRPVARRLQGRIGHHALLSFCFSRFTGKVDLAYHALLRARRSLGGTCCYRVRGSYTSQALRRGPAGAGHRQDIVLSATLGPSPDALSACAGSSQNLLPRCACGRLMRLRAAPRYRCFALRSGTPCRRATSRT